MNILDKLHLYNLHITAFNDCNLKLSNIVSKSK